MQLGIGQDNKASKMAKDVLPQGRHLGRLGGGVYDSLYYVLNIFRLRNRLSVSASELIHHRQWFGLRLNLAQNLFQIWCYLDSGTLDLVLEIPRHPPI